MPPETHASPTSHRDDLTAIAIRRLGFALRVRRFYPPASPVCARKLDECQEALHAAIGDAELQLDILPESIGWSNPGQDYRRANETDLARALHRRRVGRLHLSPGIGIDAVSAMLEELAARFDDEESDQSDLLTGALAGIRVDRLEFDQLYSSSGSNPIVGGKVWTHLLESFSDRVGSDTYRWSEIARDPEVLASFLEWALLPSTQPPEMARHAQTDAFALICEHIVAVAVEEPEVVMQTLTLAAVELFEKLDPEAWLEILSDPLHLEFGRTPQASEHELTASIARALSDEQVRSLIRYALRTRSHATPRLYRFFDRVLRERDNREAFVTDTVGHLPHARSTDVAQAWPQFLEMMAGEEVDPFMTADYHATLDEATAPRVQVHAWNLDKIAPRMAEFSGKFCHLRRARIAFALLRRETNDDDYGLLVQSLEDAIPACIDERKFDLLEQFVSTLARHSNEAQRSEAQRQAAAQAIGWLQQPRLLRQLARHLAQPGCSEFHALWRIVEDLGPACLPALFGALESRSTPAYRAQLARMLRSMTDVPWNLVRSGLASSRLAYVRDLIWVLTELNCEPARALLLEALRHEQPEVRRRAIVGLARSPGLEAEHALVDALSDPALEVRIAALHGFRACHRDSSAERLHGYLRLTNWRGQNNAVLVAAVKALAQIGDESALGPLTLLSRPPLLFRRRRRPVWLEASKAVSALQTRLRESQAEALRNGRPSSLEVAA